MHRKKKKIIPGKRKRLIKKNKNIEEEGKKHGNREYIRKKEKNICKN